MAINLAQLLRKLVHYQLLWQLASHYYAEQGATSDRGQSRQASIEQLSMMHHASKSTVLIYFEALAAASAYIINQSPL